MGARANLPTTGVNYSALKELFELAKKRAVDGVDYTIDVSLLEIYCEDIRDLLGRSNHA